jgi:hypothetical protein
MFLTVNGGVVVPLPETAAVTPVEESVTDPMEWVQVALGQAIVDYAVRERNASRQIKKSVLDMNRAFLSADQLREEAQGGFLKRMAEYDRLTKTQEAMREQFVMGRRIASETGRGLRAGLYQAIPLGERYNRRLIRLAERDGMRIERDLPWSHEPAIGGDIVTGSMEMPRLLALAEQRKGQAIVRVAQAQESAASSLAGAQEQLATLSIAVVHHEEIMDRFAALAKAQIPPAEETVAFTEPRSWEVPGVWLVSLGIAITGIFVICLALPREPEEEAVAEELLEPEAEERRYRKVV